jgi:hypothetical protein
MGPSGRAYRRIVLLALATHVLLLLNDGIYWDSWMPEYASERGDLELTVRPFYDTGVPAVAYVYYAIGRLPASVFLYKLLAFISTCAIACFTYSLAKRSRLVSDTEAQLVGITTFLWAAYRVHAVDAIAPYMAATALLLLVFHLCASRPLTLPLRIVSGVLVMGALVLYAPLYVFHYGLVATWCAIERPASPVRWLVERAEFVVLPAIVFVATHKLFPPAANLTNNYSVKLDLSLATKHAWNFIWYGVLVPVRASLHPSTLGLFVVLTALVLVVGRKRIPRWRTAIAEYPVRSWREIATCAGAAAVLFGFGALAFILVGKSPDATFWWSRNALLIPGAIGLGIVAATWIVRRLSRSPIALVAWFCLLGWIAVGSWMQHQQTYVMLQSRWVSYRSLVHNVAASGAFDRDTFLHVDEQAFLDAGYQDHTAYTWTVMFTHLGWAHEDKAVVGRLPFEYYCDEERQYPLEWRRFALTHVDLAGPHARLVIRNGPNAPFVGHDKTWGQAKLVAAYYVHRFFQPGDMGTFLAGVTSVERQPLDGDPPRCPTSLTPQDDRRIQGAK